MSIQVYESQNSRLNFLIRHIPKFYVAGNFDVGPPCAVLEIKIRGLARVLLPNEAIVKLHNEWMETDASIPRSDDWLARGVANHVRSKRFEVIFGSREPTFSQSSKLR